MDGLFYLPSIEIRNTTCNNAVKATKKGIPQPVSLEGWKMGLEPTTPRTTIWCSAN